MGSRSKFSELFKARRKSCERLWSINSINCFKIQVFSLLSCKRYSDFVVQVLSILQKFEMGWFKLKSTRFLSIVVRRQCRHIIRNFQELLPSPSPKLSSASASDYSSLLKSVHGCRSLIVQFLFKSVKLLFKFFQVKQIIRLVFALLC